jgi:ATP-binding cassette, subfamily C, bacterial CydC
MTALAHSRTASDPHEKTRRKHSSSTSPLALAGLALAVLAETGSLGLLGLSGWFIASSAVAGATLYSTFSYIAPSGGVRSFALLRIGASYGQRLVQHAAVLRTLGWIRLDFFTDAARTSSQRARPLRDGDVLDRALNDTETESMALITVISPLTVFAITGAASVLVVALTSPIAAAILAAAGIALLLLAWLAAARKDRDEAADTVRAATRAELVTAIDAWPELVSLGAAGRLAERSTDAVARLAAEQGRSSRLVINVRATAGALTAIALGLMAATAVFIDHVGAPGIALVLLLGTGMMGVASRAGEAFDALAEVRAASTRRLRMLTAGAISAAAPLGISVELGDRELVFDHYHLPEDEFRVGDRMLAGSVKQGSTLVVTGPSGSGKTTFLETLGAVLGTAAVEVSVDDHLFTGTIASNLRLARPDADDDELVRIIQQLQLSSAGIQPSTVVGVGGRALSGGEQTRLRLARAILAQPRVLIADEPTAGLDERTAHEVLHTMRERLPQSVLVLSLHSVDDRVRDALGDLAVLSLG